MTVDAEDYSEIMSVLTDFMAWKSGSPTGDQFSLFDYVSCVGSADLFFAYAELFMPSLILHRGGYFLRWRFREDLFREWMLRLGTMSSVQRVMNHIHVRSLLSGTQDIPDAVAVMMGRIIAASWKRAFSDQGLIVIAEGGCFESAAVTMYQPDD